MPIAIVGGGIFGVSVAIKLSNYFDVVLFEKNNDILNSASGINQYRLHRGYHYPRSYETALSSKKSELTFKKEFGSAVLNNSEHYYCISKNKSLTNKKQYLQFCDQVDLEYEEVTCKNVNVDEIDLCIKVNENLFDPQKLKEVCWQKLKNNCVTVHLNQNVDLKDLESYDHIILATYANQNKLLNSFPNFQNDFQFEICEKPIVELDSKIQNKSIVIMDGPFMCIDPYGLTGYSVLGNVVHAIHHTNIGKFPVIPDKYSNLLNNGIIKNPSITHFPDFIESGMKFIPELRNAKHIGSMFTIRTVLPNLEKTDARPTIVKKLSDKVISVFSGKIGNSVDAANQVYDLITN